MSFFASGQVQLDFYFQHGCRDCEYVKTFVFPKLAERFAGQYTISMLDTGQRENFIRLAGLLERFEISSDTNVCIAVGNSALLCGVKNIESGLADCIEKALTAPTHVSAPPDSADVLSKRAEKITLYAVLAAGLVDGINPCVFSTLVFLMSLLIVLKAEPRRILAAGAAYCAGSYIAYFSLGFGLFSFIKIFTYLRTVQLFIDAGMIVLLLIFSYLSFLDAWRYRKSGAAADVTMQLPDSLKHKIRNFIRKGLSCNFIVPGAFLAAVLVTSVESVCTGQLYVPVLVLLAKESDSSARWIVLLLLYNLMFIVPLVLLFLSVFKGVRSSVLISWSRRELVIAKIVGGCFFILMALLTYLL